MKRQMKKLVLGVALALMTMSLVACDKDKKDDAKTDVKVEVGDVETDVEVETGDVEADVDVEVGDIETDVEVETGDVKTNSKKITIDKYVGAIGKDITKAGYQYVGYSGRAGNYVVQYIIYDIEPEIQNEFYKLQGSNIAKILIKDNTVGLGYEPNGEKYKFNLTAGSVYMNFELVGSELIFEQYRDMEHKKIREMGELHSIPIINLQVDYMYCYAIFDESGSAIIETDNFTEETAQDMLANCKVVDFYYEYGLAD
ncbi:MAG: hypothetical protein E7263_03235 [Lachnospiraceae bacterium]|nr:hypothetical protein [Lachnospiraceae bacterium]